MIATTILLALLLLVSQASSRHVSSFPWTEKAECVAPRKPFEPKELLKGTQVKNRDDPPLPYATCDMNTVNWWSQAGEDLYIYNRFFKNRKMSHNGFFVEMGGLDGVTFSNTMIFEHCLGWNGMLIEGNSLNYQDMIKFRPCTQNVWSVTCPVGQSHAYITKSHGVSEIKKTNSASDELIMAPCRTLSSVFHEYGVKKIDFFSLDVEGFEAEVLSTINFQLVSIGVLIVELDRLGIDSGNSQKSTEKNQRVHDILVANGMFKMPLKPSEFPECLRKKAESFGDLHGSALYTSAEYRDDLCTTTK